MMQHHNLEQNSLKLSRITEEKMNHHSMDGSNSSRGANKDDHDMQQSNQAAVLDFAALKNQNFQLNFENLI